MDFLETLKTIIQIPLDAINKKKEEKQKNEEVKNLIGYGSIEGPNIPYNSDYCFDHQCLIVRSGYEHKFFCEFNIIEDIAAFSLISKDEHPIDDTTMITHSFDVTLKNGDVLELSLVVWKRGNSDPYALMSEKVDIGHLHVIIAAFWIMFKDKKTKDWANEFLESEGLLPIFDANGNVVYENIEANMNNN